MRCFLVCGFNRFFRDFFQKDCQPFEKRKYIYLQEALPERNKPVPNLYL